ncbi:MAG: hypothetical protein AAFN09_03285 [Pseudomonadota bacterium]
MKSIVANVRPIAVFLEINVDRLLPPLLVIGALTIAGWLLSYATVSLG